MAIFGFLLSLSKHGAVPAVAHPALQSFRRPYWTGTFARMNSIRVFSIACLLAALGGLSARGDTITFEGLADLQPVDSFYSGVDFSNAVAHIAGLSLNDAELPPASGSTVALNRSSIQSRHSSTTQHHENVLK